MAHLSELSQSEYAGYFERYIKLVNGDETSLSALEKSARSINSYYDNLSEAKLTSTYEAGKWTPKEVLRHLIDTERIMAYRALRFGRADKTPLAGFEQDDYVINSHANEETIASLLHEYDIVRQSTILLFSSFSEQAAARIGTGSGMSLSARSLAFMIAGHDRHHLNVLEERY